MSYEKTTWQTGDVVTAEKLNKMEDGIAGAGGIEFINQTYDDDVYTLDKTYNEISAMIGGGKLPVVIFVEGEGTMLNFINGIAVESDLILGDTYFVFTASGKEYTADSADGILSSSDGEPA